jgi:hypothetical protein
MTAKMDYGGYVKNRHCSVLEIKPTGNYDISCHNIGDHNRLNGMVMVNAVIPLNRILAARILSLAEYRLSCLKFFCGFPQSLLQSAGIRPTANHFFPLSFQLMIC